MGCGADRDPGCARLAAAGAHLPVSPAWLVVVGLGVFGFAFAVISSLHSYLILAYAGIEEGSRGCRLLLRRQCRRAALRHRDVGSRNMAVPACLWGSAAMLALCLAIVFLLPAASPHGGGRTCRISLPDGRAGDVGARCRSGADHPCRDVLRRGRIGAVVLSRYYGIFEHDTDSASEARNAYLTAVAITGCAGPAVSLLIMWLLGLIGRLK